MGEEVLIEYSDREQMEQKIKNLEKSLKNLDNKVSEVQDELKDLKKSISDIRTKKLNIPGKQYDEDWYTNHGHGD
tara:strand:+ start:585 stop:809 length:225 start_codon:yes stop_codon:yes gene_type:complete